MKETERIISLFEDLYNGQPWLDVTIAGTLNGITAAQAAQKISPKWNSIWEIVNHLIAWRLNVLERVKDNTIETPADNYFSPVQDVSDASWESTRNAFADSQQQWLLFLKTMNEADLQKNYGSNSLSYYKHIQGILQHDAYHLGQVVMLAKHA